MRSWGAMPQTPDLFMILNCSSSGLTDIGFVGSSFTWSNNQQGASAICARLDRCFANHAWTSLYPHAQVQHLSRTLSDHAPMLLQFRQASTQEPRPFRFQHMWISHPSFLNAVKQSREAPCFWTPLYILISKLKRLKYDLKQWNVHTFGNLFHNLSQAEDQVLIAQSTCDANPTAENYQAVNEARENLLKVQLQEGPKELEAEVAS